jgi:hypothetical protein
MGPSLRGASRRRNPDCDRGDSLDCFASAFALCASADSDPAKLAQRA